MKHLRKLTLSWDQVFYSILGAHFTLLVQVSRKDKLTCASEAEISFSKLELSVCESARESTSLRVNITVCLESKGLWMRLIRGFIIFSQQ